MTQETYQNILKKLAELISGTRFENHVYAVGGCVRDSILGHEIKDIDLVVSLENGGIALSSTLYANGYLNHEPVIYETYGTTMFRLSDFPHIELEAVQTRKEQYHEGSRNPETSYGTLQEDAMRRDLTVNALYYNISTGELLDPTGGQADIERRLIRVTSTPDIVYTDDPLRILRAIRFYSKLNSYDESARWSIDPETLRGMSEHVSGLTIISMERIAAELHKMLTSSVPSDALKLLKSTGAMHYVIPELEETYDMTQNEYHFGTVWEHTLKVVDEARKRTDDLNTLMAALLHDIGKIKTRSEKDGKVHFYEHERASQQMAPDILRRLKEPVEMMKEVATLCGGHMMAKSWGSDLSVLKNPEKSIRKLQHKYGRKLFKKLMVLIDADNNAHAPEHCIIGQTDAIIEVSERIEKFGTDMFDYKLPIDGEDVMNVRNIPPSAEVRDCLEYCIKLALNDPLMSRDEMLKHVKSYHPKENKKYERR